VLATYDYLFSCVRDIRKRNTPKSWKRRRSNINTNKILMKTYKEFISLLEKFKPFPEDKVSRQIEKKKQSGSNQDAHKMKVAKNFMTKSDDANNPKRAIDTIRKNTYAAVHKGDDVGKNAQNVSVVSTLIKGHNKKSKLKDLKQQSEINKKNKDNKKLLNKIYKKDENPRKNKVIKVIL